MFASRYYDPTKDKQILLISGLLSLFIFLIDLKVPLGVAVGLAYCLPLALTGVTARKSFILVQAFMSISLIGLDYLIQSSWVVDMSFASANRILSILNIVIFTPMILRLSSRKLNLYGFKGLLRESNLIKKAFDSSSEGLIVCNKDGKVLHYNSASKKILGLGPVDSDMTEWSSIYRVYFPDQETPFPSQKLPLVIALRDGKSARQKLFIKRSESNGVNIEVRADPVKEGDEIVGAICSFRNIQKEIELFGQFLQSQKMEAMGRLAGGIAHDFNNKLGAMKLIHSNIQDKIKAGKDISDDLNTMDICVDNCSSLTNQILAFSRKQILSPKLISLHGLIIKNESIYRKILGENINFIIHLNANHDKILMDPGQMEQVILNLLVNSREALRGGGTITISTSLPERKIGLPNEQSGCVCLSVTDTGSGIPRDIEDKVFDVYFSTKKKGSGLGLSTVHGIVNQSGGVIRLNSKAQQGTTFEIYFPLSQGQEEISKSKSKKMEPPKNLRVLVVEDEEPIREAMLHCLTKMGYRVCCAGTAEEALNCQDINKIDLLISDIILPMKSGRALVEILKADFPTLKTLLVSGYTETDISTLSGDDGAVELLRKPFSEEQLKKAIVRVFSEPIISEKISA